VAALGEELRGLSPARDSLGHGRARGFCPVPLLGGAVGSLPSGHVAHLRDSRRDGRFFKYRHARSFPGLASDHVPHLRSDPSVLQSIMGLGALSAFHCRAFSRHDLDVCDPLLARRTDPLERKGLSTRGCRRRVFCERGAEVKTVSYPMPALSYSAKFFERRKTEYREGQF